MGRCGEVDEDHSYGIFLSLDNELLMDNIWGPPAGNETLFLKSY